MAFFQSHLGLISTPYLMTSYSLSLQKSFNPILVWFQRFSRNPLHGNLRPLSIPSWSDFNEEINEAFNKLIKLSIPSWSDFNFYEIPEDITFTLNVFQSHLGLISTIKEKHLAFNYDNFQSHLGLISTLWEPIGKFTSKLIIFQSHLGLISTDNMNELIAYALFFQSHLGLISTQTVVYGGTKINATFNPILVWFQPPVIFPPFPI